MNYVRYGLIVRLCMCMHVTVTEQVGVNEQDMGVHLNLTKISWIVSLSVKNERNKEQ